MIAIDVQKAFDCIHHDRLCQKLDIMGRDSSWFKSYLSNSQIVFVNGTNSKVHEIICGVPRGSLFGPLLYLRYCNDREMLVNCKSILYAGDRIVMVSDKDPKVIKTKLVIELNSINNWLIENKLSLHPGRCEIMLFLKNVSAKEFQTLILCKMAPH